MTASSSSNSPRGVIILDASVLKLLAFPLAQEHKDGSHKGIQYFYEILPFLATQGYQIIIPEMVAYEMSNLLADGKDTESYFSHSSRFGKTGQILKKFIGEVIKGKYPNIAVIPSTEPEEVRAFLGSLYDVCKQFDYPCAKAREKLQDIHGQNKRNYGEKAIGGLLNDASMKAQNPIVLINDMEAARDLSSRHENVAICSLAGCINALCSGTLGTALGISSTIPPNSINRYIMRQNFLTHSGWNSQGTGPRIDIRGADYQRYLKTHKLESSLDNFKAFLETRHPMPFSAAMHNLARELGLDRIKNTERTVAASTLPPETDRVAQFRKRFPHWRPIGGHAKE